uniref:UvrD-helicase domain-containing protein n=1 Tax=Neoaquamicrobium sediminum TaxID=1849104 RepID=UPI0028B01399|nr:UvrD-helicase domain-containing protein [Mesorhizobium sediminum]
MSARLTVPEDTRTAQATASMPGVSAWVSANAGSGKTHVLSQRVIRLLLGGAEPSRVLCLTYTRAAAANMANRVFASLARWTTLDEDKLATELAELDGRSPDQKRLRFARQLFARALETPGGLKIQTIHAFCEAVLHQFPLEANIAGHFQLLDSSQMEAALVAEARREMVALAAGDGQPELAEAFASVLAYGGESGLESLLGAIIAQRGALGRFIAQAGEADTRFRPLFAEFGFADGETPATLAETIWPDPYFNPSLANAIGSRATAAGKAIAETFSTDLSGACALADPVERLKTLRTIFLTRKAGVWSPKSATRIMAKGVGEYFPEFAQEFQRFASVIETACDRVALLSMLEATRAALVLADWLIARYERLKSARGFLDFNDLIARTRRCYPARMPAPGCSTSSTRA